MMNRLKSFFYLAALLIFLAGLFPLQVQALAIPPENMFQLPWERGLAWIAMDTIDDGSKRLPTSPHNYKMGGALDFAPHVGMKIGEDTSNAWVTAAAAGTVYEVSYCHVKINHGNGWTSEYYHLANVQVQVGSVVAQNQHLGIIDNNAQGQVCLGNIWPGPHVHFAIRPNLVGATLAGWKINYNVKKNQTTFDKYGQSLGSYQPILNDFDAQVIMRGLLEWNTLETGNVDAYRYERWSVQLPEQRTFTVTASRVSGDLTPLLILMNASGGEIARAAGTLTSAQPAGSYYVQVQPQSGSGAYNIILQQQGAGGLSASAAIEPSSILVGETALVSISLNNVPASGLTSAEFTCNVDPTLVEIGNITAANLFGNDPASALNGPQNGHFIFAIAGSHGQRATTSGVAFTFTLRGLQPGQAVVNCSVRVSQGDQQLIAIPFFLATLLISGNVPVTPTATSPPSTATLPPSTATSPPSLSTVNGRAIAYKPAAVRLYAADASLVNTVVADAGGNFSMTAPPGNYTITASVEGYLGAQGNVTLTAGAVATLPTITLLAGDIDGNSVIDQFDVLTIGMGYNTALPSAADLNNDGVINILDLELLAVNYRRSGTLVWQ